MFPRDCRSLIGPPKPRCLCSTGHWVAPCAKPRRRCLTGWPWFEGLGDGRVGRRWTSERVACALLERFQPGERVAVWAPNLPKRQLLYLCLHPRGQMDVGVIMFTSGTTGAQKGVMFHHKGIVNMASFTQERGGLAQGGVCVNPMFHIGVLGHAAVVTGVFPGDTPHDQAETIGQVMPHVEVKIADPITGAVLPLGQPGEICARGYLTMLGYFSMPEETAKTFKSDGWLHSGDLGTMDERGFLRITGRIKDLLIRGGELLPVEKF